MGLVSHNQALIFFVLLIIVAIFLSWWMDGHHIYDKSRLHTFISILIGFGVLVTFLFYYNVVQLQNHQQELAATQELARINDSLFNNVLDSIRAASNNIPNFVLSITPLTNTVCCNNDTGSCTIAVDMDPINPQTCTEKMTLSFRIFSLWQDLIISNKFLDYDPLGYVCQFLQLANSSQLFSQWSVSKISFNLNTQIFGDLLFEYGLPITNQTPQSYSDAAKVIIDDPRYQKLFNFI